MQILCVKNKGYLHFCPLWGFRGGRFNPHYAIPCLAFTINNGRANVRQGLRQAYSPPPRRDAFFPNASHWAELTRPFRAVY